MNYKRSLFPFNQLTNPAPLYVAAVTYLNIYTHG